MTMDTHSDEKFPAGMRVLVVDDDPTCLKMIEALLLKCQYHVTTTTRPREALRMLKENRNRFQLVITDVHMPEMDGNKLLQLVGLEMDLPVIMLSAYGETRDVMKGIRNGACDFLLKPVRIQELQNIWQHVVRKNKSYMQRRPSAAVEDGGRAPAPAALSTDQDGTLNQRIMEDNNAGDYDDGDEEDLEGSEQENEEPTTRKKNRLFWSVELHQKFVDAVNQLGPDKAFPKKILDLMNVEGLTREKVASHLQKYRLYLKKMETASSQATKRVAGLGAEDAHIRSLGLGGGYGIFRSLAGSGRFPGATSSLSHQAGGVLGQLNTAAALSMGSLSSSAMLQRSQYANASSSLTTLGKFDPMRVPATQNASSMFQGTPMILQQNTASLLSPPASSSMLNRNPPQNTRSFLNQSPLSVNPSNIGALEGIVGSSAPLLNSFQPSVPPPSFQHNPVPCNVPGNGILQASAPMQNIQDDVLDLFCGISSLEEFKGNVASHDIGGANNSNNLAQPQSWQNHGPDYILNSCNLPNASSCLITAGGPFDQTLSQSNNNVTPLPYSQMEGAASHFMQQAEVQKSIGDSSLRLDENYLLDDTKLLGGSSQNSSEYLEDIVGRFLKQGNGEMETEQQDFDLDSFAM